MEEVNNQVLVQIPKHQSTPKEHNMDRSERRSLQTLQAAPNGNGLNGGKDHVKDIGKSILLQSQKEQNRLQPKSLTIYQDDQITDSSSVHCSRGTQTDKSLVKHQHSHKIETEVEDTGGDSAYFDQEAFDLMANENIPESYWKDLAEERRRALEESLEENGRLSLENSQLKEENSRLSDVAQEAKELKELLEGVLSDDDDSAEKFEDPIEPEHLEDGASPTADNSPVLEEAQEKKDESP